MTWFGGKDYVRFIDADENGVMKSFDRIINDAERYIFERSE
jgi:hypothetical protein